MKWNRKVKKSKLMGAPAVRVDGNGQTWGILVTPDLWVASGKRNAEGIPQSSRPNAWWRWWQFVLLGWRWVQR